MVSIFFYGWCTCALYRQDFDRETQALVTLFYSLLPYNIYYNRVFIQIQPLLPQYSLYVFLCTVGEVREEQVRIGAHAYVCDRHVGQALCHLASIPMFYWVMLNWGTKTFKAYRLSSATCAFIPIALCLSLSLHPEGVFCNWLLNGDGFALKEHSFAGLFSIDSTGWSCNWRICYLLWDFTAFEENTSLFFVWHYQSSFIWQYLPKAMSITTITSFQ